MSLLITLTVDGEHGRRGKAMELPDAVARQLVQSAQACFGGATLAELDALDGELGQMHAQKVAPDAPAKGETKKPPKVGGSAIFSDDRRFRYMLKRTFLPATGTLHRLCVWLNPSDADEEKDDASVRVGMGFAKRWGDAGIIIVNTGDLVETYSKNLPPLHADRLGPDHWEHIERAIAGDYGHVHADVLCGWGDEGAGVVAEETVRRLRAAGLFPCALALTKSGNPGHPLRKKADLVPVPFETKAEARAKWKLAVDGARAKEGT